jgi:hypothetical protein
MGITFSVVCKDGRNFDPAKFVPACHPRGEEE